MNFTQWFKDSFECKESVNTRDSETWEKKQDINNSVMMTH